MGDRTLVRHSTNMLEPDVVRWSMLHHLPDPIASASYQSALCYAYYPFCSGGSWVPAQQVPHRCLMTAMRALQMRRWDGQLAKKPGAATTCIRDAQPSPPATTNIHPLSTTTASSNASSSTSTGASASTGSSASTSTSTSSYANHLNFQLPIRL